LSAKDKNSTRLSVEVCCGRHRRVT